MVTLQIYLNVTRKPLQKEATAALRLKKKAQKQLVCRLEYRRWPAAAIFGAALAGGDVVCGWSWRDGSGQSKSGHVVKIRCPQGVSC